MGIYLKTSTNAVKLTHRLKIWCACSVALTIIPDEDCDVIVTYELDGWGYSGNKWERIVKCSNANCTKALERKFCSHGHNSTYVYSRGIAVFTGLKSGGTYTFESADSSGKTGGFSNPFMSIIPVNLV